MLRRTSRFLGKGELPWAPWRILKDVNLLSSSSFQAALHLNADFKIYYNHLYQHYRGKLLQLGQREGKMNISFNCPLLSPAEVFV